MSEALTAKSWPEVWNIGRQHQATHYNYSRGKVRFRAVLEDPEDIGTPTTIPANDSIRIRFYRETKEDYAEVEGVEVLLTLPTDYFLDLPAGFDEATPAERAQHVLAQMHKFSAVRWQKQMDAAERILWGHIDYLQKTIDQKNQLIASLQKKVDELMNSRGVSNLYDFLVHPNAQNAIETIGRVVSRPAPEPAAEPPLQLDDPMVRSLVERALESPEILRKLESLAKR